MNQKRINEFSKKLKAIDDHLDFEVFKNTTTDLNGNVLRLTGDGDVLITYGDEAIFELTIIDDTPAIDLDSSYIDKDNASKFGDLIKLCGEYLDAFFDGDQHEQ